MEKLVIKGGKKLEGEINIQGAKNSSLPLLAAAILCKGETILHNCPNLSDVKAAGDILEYIGCKTRLENNSFIIETTSIKNYEISDSLMRQMRSSVVFLGAIIGRLGRAKISFPGGCEIGSRPIDLHLSALRDLGVIIDEMGGILDCYIQDKGLIGTKISLSFPSVGATENIILTAVKSKGTTTINNAAQEPEIVDLANFLNKCGAKIVGAGNSVIKIQGVEELYGCEYTIMSDRIVATTYLSCAAITGGEILLKNIDSRYIESVFPIFRQTGCTIIPNENSIYIKSKKNLSPMKCIRTMPYPGFPTDSQSLIMAVSLVCKGTSVFIENIFENRFKVVDEFRKMGANVSVEGKVCVVEGVSILYGSKVHSTDLRGGAALVVAGLAAEGETNVFDIHHIDRGYENFEKNLNLLGACIKREQ